MNKWFIATLLSVAAMTGCNKPPAPAVDAPAVDEHFATSDVTNEPASQDTNFDELIALIESTIGENEAPALPFDPPLSSADAETLLQQCLKIILTDPATKHSREFYGTPGDASVILTNGREASLPVGFKPNVEDFQIEIRRDEIQVGDSNRILGVRVDKLDLTSPKTGFMDGNITLTTYNAGGSKNGTVIGGCFHYFVVRRDGEKLVAEYSGSLDP